MTVWEIFSRGASKSALRIQLAYFLTGPYGTLTNQEVYERIKDGIRLEKPDDMPMSLWKHCRLCW